jgi:uncharacterized glyoxalase superfamily protein PhnB
MPRTSRFCRPAGNVVEDQIACVDAFYGDRFGWVLDPFGHLWALGTVKEELTPEQVHERMVASHG